MPNLIFVFASTLAFAIALLPVHAADQFSASDPPETTNQTNAPTTLDNLVAQTLAKNPELRFYEAEIAAARAGRKQAGAFPNPELSGDVGRKRLSGGDLSAEGTAWSVSLMQPFEWPGRISLRKAIANRDIELAELGYDRFKLALSGRVRVLAYTLLAAQQNAAAAREVANRFTALREVLVQREPAGVTPLLETRVVEATALNSERKASTATLAQQAALLELNQLRGAPPETPLSILPPSLLFAPLRDQQLFIQAARSNNFDIRARSAELEQQGFRVKLAKNERYPTVSVGPSFSEERAGERERVLAVGVSIPLPLWNRNSGNIQAADARRVQAETSLLTTAREVERKTIEALLSYHTKLQEMDKWRPDSVDHFREAAELADRHYRLGAVPISTYVELQEQYLDAVEGLLETRREALSSAAELEVLAGLPVPLTLTAPTGDQK